MSIRGKAFMLYILFGCILCSALPLAGQVADTVVAFQKLQEALDLRSNHKYRNALDLFQEATDLYMQSLDSNDIRIAELYSYHSGLHRILGQPLQQYEVNKKSLEIIRANSMENTALAANIHNSLGISSSDLKQYEEAEFHYKKAIQISNNLGEEEFEQAPIYGNLGILARRTGAFDDALAYLSKAMEVYEQKQNIVGKAQTHINLGNAYVGLFENEKAFYHYQKANEYEDSLAAISPMIPFSAYQGIAKYYKDRLEYEYALLNYEKAKTYVLAAFGINHPYYFRNERLISQVYYQMGRNQEAIDVILDDVRRLGYEVKDGYVYELLSQNYRAMDSLSQARYFVEKSKELVIREEGENSNDYAYPLMEEALNLLKERRYTEAEPVLKACRERLARFLPLAHPRIARIESFLGEVYANTGRFDEAVAFCDSALIKLGHHPDSIFSYEKSKLIRSWEFSHRMKSIVLYAQYQEEPTIMHARQALEVHLAHLEYMHQIQAGLVENESKLQLFDNLHDVSERAIELLLFLHASDPAPGKLELAFQVADRSKDNLLAELSIKKRMRESENRTLQFGARESELLAAIADLQLEVFHLREIQAPEKDVLDAKNMILAKREEILKLYDSGANGKEQLLSEPAFSASFRIDGLLPEKTACLQFFQGEKETCLLVGVRDSVYFGGQVATRELNRAIEKFKESLVDIRSEAWKEVGYSLYSQLLAHPLSLLDTSIRNLLIIPDGTLAAIPFEAIGLDETGIELLIDNFTISYSPSLSVLEKQKEKTAMQGKKVFAAFAPIYEELKVGGADSMSAPQFTMLVRSGNYHLPGAQEEAREIREITRGELFSGTAANERTFKEKAGDYRILHLSMHAILEDQNPAFSRLIFSPGAQEDGFLFTNELTALDLDADMAVLSACNTGSGILKKGEGVMSLARAFHHSGVRATTHSLWKVPDDATKEIMVTFYQNLEKGMNKAAALHDAKLAYRESQIASERTHPYYWAGFILNGSLDPVPFSRKYAPLWYLLAIGLLLGAGFFLYLRNKTRRKS